MHQDSNHHSCSISHHSYSSKHQNPIHQVLASLFPFLSWQQYSHFLLIVVVATNSSDFNQFLLIVARNRLPQSSWSDSCSRRDHPVGDQGGSKRTHQYLSIRRSKWSLRYHPLQLPKPQSDPGTWYCWEACPQTSFAKLELAQPIFSIWFFRHCPCPWSSRYSW